MYSNTTDGASHLSTDRSEQMKKHEYSRFFLKRVEKNWKPIEIDPIAAEGNGYRHRSWAELRLLVGS